MITRIGKEMVAPRRWRGTLTERLWPRVDKNGPVVSPELGPCWQWTGGVIGTGYGEICRDGEPHRKIRVHRAAWLLTHGEEPPSSLDMCHRCDNRRCVNPGHLFVGTRKDNMADAASKARVRHGEEKPNHKLKYGDVEVILRLHRLGNSIKGIARAYGVSGHAIRRIVRGQGWLHPPRRDEEPKATSKQRTYTPKQLERQR